MSHDIGKLIFFAIFTFMVIDIWQSSEGYSPQQTWPVNFGVGGPRYHCGRRQKLFSSFRRIEERGKQSFLGGNPAVHLASCRTVGFRKRWADDCPSSSTRDMLEYGKQATVMLSRVWSSNVERVYHQIIDFSLFSFPFCNIFLDRRIWMDFLK